MTFVINKDNQIEGVLCNKCGKSCYDGHMNNEYGEVSATFGYGSDMDGLEFRLHWCELCFKNWFLNNLPYWKIQPQYGDYFAGRSLPRSKKQRNLSWKPNLNIDGGEEKLVTKWYVEYGLLTAAYDEKNSAANGMNYAEKLFNKGNYTLSLRYMKEADISYLAAATLFLQWSKKNREPE